ncbi:hypothetical protein N9383_04620 [Granulosicoccus sp.]|nr:hypothetical protein [Granulosicoccus sp.]
MHISEPYKQLRVRTFAAMLFAWTQVNAHYSRMTRATDVGY